MNSEPAGTIGLWGHRRSAALHWILLMVPVIFLLGLRVLSGSSLSPHDAGRTALLVVGVLLARAVGTT